MVEGLEARVLWREAAFGGDVYEEEDFAAVLGEGVGRSLFWGWGGWVSCLYGKGGGGDVSSGGVK